MNKVQLLIALAFASFVGLHAPVVYAEAEQVNPVVTVIGNSAPDAVDGHASNGDLTPEGGGGGSGGGAGGGDTAPPQPAPPASAAKPAPPPQTKAQCEAKCALDRLIRDNKCTGDADAFRRSLAAEAQAAQRAKFGWMILKNLGVDMDLSDAALANIDRQVADFRSFCGGIAADAQNACLETCKTLALLLGVFGWLREA